jgi:tRNA-specific 2-thiouridylase
MSKKKVMVAMSGGVDSSVTAALLIDQGYECVGVTMRITASVSAIEGARAVADALGICHHVVDLRREFQKEVVEYFVASYISGQTPNPCVVCNPKIKLGLLVERAGYLGCDCVATGHYARVFEDAESRRWCLAKGIDSSKDQSYYLYGLTQAQLARLLLPLGEYTKQDVRSMASNMGLPTAQSEESQDICFLEGVDYRSFLRQSWPESLCPGPIMDRSGRVLGQHEGLAFYTLGQRKGLGLSSQEALYVLELDPVRNAVIVGSAREVYSSALVAADVNWVSVSGISAPLAVSARVRYRTKPAEAVIEPLDDGRVVTVFAEPQRAITPGQSVVWYKDDLVVGGGRIETLLSDYTA